MSSEPYPDVAGDPTHVELGGLGVQLQDGEGSVGLSRHFIIVVVSISYDL